MYVRQTRAYGAESIVHVRVASSACDTAVLMADMRSAWSRCLLEEVGADAGLKHK